MMCVLDMLQHFRTKKYHRLAKKLYMAEMYLVLPAIINVSTVFKAYGNQIY